MKKVVSDPAVSPKNAPPVKRKSGQTVTAGSDRLWWYAGGAGVSVALLTLIGIGIFSAVHESPRPPAAQSQTGTRRAGQQPASGPPRAEVIAKEEGPGRRLAFLVGGKSYDHADLKNLEFPENDVRDLADVLKRQGFTVTLMSTTAAQTDKEHFPDADNIRTQLSAALKGVTKRDLILVGLAGHGLQPLNSSQSYFCPHNANPSERNGDVAHPETLLSIGEVLAQTRDSGIGQKLLLVDACRNDPEVRGGRRGGGTIQVDVSALPRQTGVLLSCDRGEFSFESQAFGGGHGVFFFEVIEGLNGAAKDEDGEITWENLRSFVRKRVPSAVRKVFGKNGGEQNPNEIGNLTGEPTVLAIARVAPSPEPKPEPAKPKPGNEPDLLVAPFDEKEALAARKAWAQYHQIAEERRNSIGIKLTLIPAGEFQMGSTPADVEKVAQFDFNFKKEYGDAEQPQHRVRITRPFYLRTYEVTKAQFRKFVGDTGYKTDAEKDGKGGFGYTGKKNSSFERRASFNWRDWGADQTDESPVVNVSHNDAVAFCQWLSKKKGKEYRLPTEAEWEYACRAGTTSLYYNGDDPENLTKIGNVADVALKATGAGLPYTTVSSSDGWAFTAPVGQFRPNNFGLYDMIGNAFEWFADWYDAKYYAISGLCDPTGPASGSLRGYRGGCWILPAGGCRSAFRLGDSPDHSYSLVGFRVAAVPSGK